MSDERPPVVEPVCVACKMPWCGSEACSDGAWTHEQLPDGTYEHRRSDADA